MMNGKKTSNNDDIIKLILEDHKSLKYGIKILTSEEASDADKQKALKKFINDLVIHSKVEEQSLYDNVVAVKKLRESILEGYEEHALADILVEQLESSGYESEWDDEIGAKAKVLAELVEHHVEEEEEETLPEVRSAFAKHELVELGQIYLAARSQMRDGTANGKKPKNIEITAHH